jgi:O-antigen/teichoic acid export membrane protein
MLTFSDRWILGHYRSLAEVGLYSLAYNLSMILNMFVSSINTAWGPVYYDLAATEEGRSKLPRLTTVFAASITMVAMGYLLFSREALLVLATARYHAAAPLVPIIVAGYFAFAMYVVLSTAIFYHRKTKYIPLISAGAAVVNISLNLLLVPRYGMWAAAWMTLVAYTIMAIAARMLSGRLFPGGFEDARIAKLVALFLAVFGANYGVNVLGLPVWGSIAAKLAVFTLASLSIVWLDIIAISELRALVDRVARRRQRARSMEEGRALEAAEQTIDGSMADDTGFHQDRS